MSIVRDNLMSRQGYTPYCGGPTCRIMPRTMFDKTKRQFRCSCCGWVSSYEPEFIDKYTEKWNIK